MKKLWINEREYVLFNDLKQPKLSQEIATRKRSLDYYSIIKNLPDPDPVLREQDKDIKVYREMLCDPHVWACVQSRKSGVLSLEWEIDRGKAKTQQAEFIESIFNNIDLNSVISEILDATLFGFQPIEVNWQRRGSYIVPSEIMAKPVEWFVFDEDNLLMLKTKENFNGELLPDKKFLCPRYNPSYQNPYGERTLSRIFWNVTFKRGGVRFWSLFTEKYGMPFLVAKHPRATEEDETENLATMLDSMIQDAIAVIPDDSSIEIQESNKTSSADIYEKLVDKMNSEISKAILGQTLTTEIGNKGSYSASKTHMDVRKDIIDADKRIVERTLNQLIQWIYELNFTGQNDIPVFSMYEEEDVDLTLAQRDKILADAGVKFTKKYLMKAYGFEEEDIVVSEAESEANSNNKNILKLEKNFREFKQNQTAFPDQETIDDFIDSFSADELQEQAKTIFGSVFDLVNKASSYEEIQEKLSEQGVKTDQIEKVLQKVIFISEIWGHLNGND